MASAVMPSGDRRRREAPLESGAGRGRGRGASPKGAEKLTYILGCVVDGARTAPASAQERWPYPGYSVVPPHSGDAPILTGLPVRTPFDPMTTADTEIGRASCRERG